MWSLLTEIKAYFVHLFALTTQVRPVKTQLNNDEMEPTETIGITSAEAVFYATCFCVAAMAGAFRVVRDRDYQSVSSLVGVCGCAGLLGFCVVAFLCRSNGASAGSEFYFLAVSSFVGLMGKEQDKLMRWGFSKVAGVIGIDLKDDKDARAD